MKTIYILTIHFGVNHGSALQAYALNRFLAKNGYQVKTIDYVPQRYNLWKGYYESKRDRFSLPLILLYYPLYLAKVLPNRVRFEHFLNNYIPLTQKIVDRTKLPIIGNEADCYIVGSDQVWNDDYNGKEDNSYFLDFVTNGKKRVAYAASFGKEVLSEQYFERIISYLQKFDFISLRENTTISRLGASGISAIHVCDPTMLLDKEEWNAFVNVPNVINTPYLLVYVMDGKYERLLDWAYQIKKKFSYEIYVVSFNKIKDSRIDKQFTSILPNQFITLISGATCVVTNSFHGTVFSII